MISSGDGDPGNTDATHTGTLQLNQTRVTANTEAEAIGAAVSGSITVNVGTEFSTDTFGLGSGSAFRVETDEGISVVEFEDLVGISGSTPDWDYDDRTWTFDVTEAPAEAIIYEKDHPLFDDSPGPVLHATVHVTVTANNPAYPDQFVWNYHLSNIDALYPGGYGIEAFSLPIPDDLIPQNLTNTMGWDTFVTHSALYSPSNGILWTGGTETGPWLMPNGSADFTFTTEPRTIVTGDSEIWSIGFGYGGGGGGAVAKPGEKVSVDLDIGGTYDNGKTFTEATEDSIGGLVVRRAEDNNAPRREIILRKVMDPNHPDVAWDGSVQLDRLNKKLKVFTAATDGTEITFNGTDNVFNNSNLPLSLWVQGDIGSLVMRDSIMRLSPIIGNAATKEGSDSVSFTVFWVSVSLKFDGSVSSDNSAKENWKSYTKDGKGDLGLQAGNNVGGANLPDTYGWGFEAKGEVQPSNFNYPRSDVRLDRDAAAKLFGKTPTTLNGPVANPANLPGAFSASIPPGNDQSLITFRDDDPGTIYDLDSPGFLMQVRGQGEILRFRMNFKEYALLTSDGVRYRTSAIKEGHVAFSIQQKTAPQGTDWQPLPFASVDAVAGDYSAGQGHINLSWDLK